MDVLSVNNLTKKFGAQVVLNDISLSVPEGSVFGFIGANGAGKTTTMKLILGLLSADGGQIFVDGDKVTFGETRTNRKIGYLPDVPVFYPYMRPKEYLSLCAKIVGVPAPEIPQKSAELLKLVGLEKTSKKIGGFSRGMKQRLGMAQALLNAPKLLICDEPTSALDPIGRKDILDILARVKEQTTVIFSTHILSDVERVCDRAAVLNEGRIAACGTLAELRSGRETDSIKLSFSLNDDKERFLSLLGGGFSVNAQTETEVTLHFNDLPSAERKILSILSENALLPQKLEVLEPTIESLFLEVSGQ